MKIIPSTVLTNPDDAEFFMTAEVISVDIETDTTPRSEEWMSHGSKYGLSYVADMTDVALYTPGHPPLILDMHGYPEKNVEFLRRLFSREDPYTVIAHNAVFDLRSLGGHVGFLLKPNCRVWDTQVISIRMTISDGADDETDSGSSKAPPINFQQSSLRALIELHGLIEDPDEKLFLSFMKDNRAWLSNMEDVLSHINSDHVIWRILKRSKDKVLASDQGMKAASERMIQLYVAMDAITTYLLYEEQKRIISVVKETAPKKDWETKAGVVVYDIAKNVRIPSWPELPEIIDWELRGARILANQAIRGVKLNMPYVHKLLSTEIKRSMDFGSYVRSFPDPSDDRPNWTQRFMMMWWLRMSFEALIREPTDNARGWKYKHTYSIPKSDQNWSFDPDFDYETELRPYLRGENLDEWMAWARSLHPDMKSQAIRKLAPVERSMSKIMDENGEPVEVEVVEPLTPPVLLLRDWVVATSKFPTEDYWQIYYLAQIKLKFWTAWVKNTEAKLPEDLDSFAPYMMFVKCQIPFPDDHDLRYIQPVKTDSYRNNVLYKRDSRGDRVLQEDDDALEEGLKFALANPQSNPFGTGHKSLSYLGAKHLGWKVDDEEDIESREEPAAIYWKLMRSQARTQTLEMFRRHASRDGRIHTMMMRARTGRNRSQNPNIQNLQMAYYRGIFIADDGFWLGGLDYSNAENKSGASIARDNAFANATERGDFHTNMAWTYKPEQMRQYQIAGEIRKMKELRNFLKRVTFSIPYGAGATKIAELLICSIDEAIAILEARKAAFKQAERAKQRWIEMVDRMYHVSHLPTPYITNWTGARIRVPVTMFYGKIGPKRNAIWNYLQQSSVAEMIFRATVLITEEFERRGLKSWLAFNVHDEEVPEIAIDEYPEVPLVMSQIMNHVYPQEWARRTVPAVHNVADFGPSNYAKWGYTENPEDYPFPGDEFVNEWGVHKLDPETLELPLGYREHETWLGPVHLGWTLDQEIIDIANGLTEDIGLPKGEIEMAEDVKVQGDEWDVAVQMIEQFVELFKEMKPHVPVLEEILNMPKTIRWQYTDKNTNEKKKVVVESVGDKMRVMTEMAANGYMVDTYNRHIDAINGAAELVAKMTDLVQLIEEVKRRESANSD